MCARANRAATALEARIATAQRASDPDVVYRDVAVLTRTRSATAQRYLTSLDALTPPSDDRDAIKGWIAGQRRRQQLVLALADAFAAREDARISTLSQRIDAANSVANAFARRYGLTACARTVA